jgi:branched-chain amino acid transport system ATP-binding protein
MLKVDNIHTYYGNSHILQGVSFEIGENSIVGISGRNGAGKTTTIYSIINLTPLREGVIKFREIDITGLQPHKIAQMGISLVPQGRRIFTSLSVKENLTIAARNINRSWQSWNLDRIFSLFPRLRERCNLRARVLSGGELQMLAIARALMTNPEFLLMDEPTEGLAPLVVEEILRVILKLKEENKSSILLVEQYFQIITGIIDYIYLMSNGKVVYESTPQELMNNEEVKAKYLGV